MVALVVGAAVELGGAAEVAGGLANEDDVVVAVAGDICLQEREVVGVWLEGKDLACVADAACEQQRVIAEVSPHIEHDISGMKLPQQQVGLEGLVELAARQRCADPAVYGGIVQPQPVAVN